MLLEYIYKTAVRIVEMFVLLLFVIYNKYRILKITACHKFPGTCIVKAFIHTFVFAFYQISYFLIQSLY